MTIVKTPSYWPLNIVTRMSTHTVQIYLTVAVKAVNSCIHVQLCLKTKLNTNIPKSVRCLIFDFAAAAIGEAESAQNIENNKIVILACKHAVIIHIQSTHLLD